MTRSLTIPVLGGIAAWAFPAMADAVLKATCLLAVVLAADCLLRRRSSAARHLLYVATFGLLLALPALTLVLPGWQVLPQWLQVSALEEPPATPVLESRASMVSDFADITRMRTDDSISLNPELSRTESDSFAAAMSEVPASSERDRSPAMTGDVAAPIEATGGSPVAASGALSRSTRDACVLLWLAGAALLLLRLLFGGGLLWRAKRTARLVTEGPLHQLLESLRSELGLRRPVRLFLGHKRAMPMAWGVWRSCILAPAGIEEWSPSQQRAVLLHELGHVARRDPVWQLIVELGRAVYWFHPLVWLAAWRVHVERERACDDLVINRGVAAKDYARHLLDVVSRGRLRAVRPAIGVAMASTRKLEGRMRSILDERRNRRPVTRTVAVAGLLACVAVGLPLAMMRAADDSAVAETPQGAAEDVTADANPDRAATDSETATATIEPASPEEITRRVREQLYVLRQHRVFSRSDYWGGAMRELIEIGEPAVPELVAELDRTDRDETLSALGFILRGIGDPRAVPALIRNIPKLLRAPRSDYGIYIHDPELRAFLKQFERYQDDGPHVSYGRPVNEILDTLQKLTGHSEPAGEDDPLRHVTLSGGAEQRVAAREAYAARQAHWEQWWSEHQGEFVTDEALRSLELPPQEGDPVAEAGLARFGPTFPTGPDVRLGPVREVELDSYNYWDAPSHFDFDTGRVFQYLEEVEQVEPESPDDMFSVMVNWPPEMGIDVRVNEGEDLHVWQIENERWETIEDEIRSGEPLELGAEATDWLVRFDGHRANFQRDRIGTFLITTREGGRGIVQSHPRDALTGRIKLRYRMWLGEDGESPPPHARARETAGAEFGGTQTLTLPTPGRGKAFLLDLDAGQSVTPPDSVLPADVTAEFSYSDSEPFAEWCRENGVDIASRLTRVFFEASADSDASAPNRVISLVGLRMLERKVLPDAFDTMTVPEAWEILRRYPESSEYAWLSAQSDIAHQPDTFVIQTRTGRIALLRIWETAEDLSSVTIHYRLAPEQSNPRDRDEQQDNDANPEGPSDGDPSDDEGAATTTETRVSARPAGADDADSTRIIVTYDIPDAEPEARVFVQDLDRGRDIGSVVEGPMKWNPLANGETLELDDLEPGRYQVARRRLVEIGRVGEHRVQNSIYFDRRTFTLAAGETKRIDITRPNGKPVTGRVPGMEDLGVERAVVYACSDNATDAESPSNLDVTIFDVQPCNADGEFVTERLSPGTYMLIVKGYTAIPPEVLSRTGDITPRFVGTARVIVPESGEPAAVEVTLTDTRVPQFGSVSIDYNVFGGPDEATFMLNLSKRATPVAGAERVERNVTVTNGEPGLVERLVPGTYQMARIKPIRFVDFTRHCWLDYREVEIEAGERTETRFVRGRGRSVRGEVVGLRRRVGDFGQGGSQDGAGLGETLACVLVRSADAPDPELVSGPPWHPNFDVTPCRPNGAFETEPLEPGTYNLYAHVYRRLTPEQRVRTGDILPTWRGSATVTVPEEGEPEFVEMTLEPFEREPAIGTGPDDESDSDGGESQPPETTSQVVPGEPPVSITGEIELRQLVAALLPDHRLRQDDQGAPSALASPESGELKIPAGGDVEGGPIGYWLSPPMTFLSDARPVVPDGAAAAQLIQLLHALCEGPDFVRQKIYRPRAIDNGWLVEVDHDFENYLGMIPFVHPYEMLVDEDSRVTSLCQRSNVYLGNAEVYVDTIKTVYEREVRVNGGINYPEVLEEELKQAWARERGVPLRHNSLVHYPNAVISVTDEATGERFYVESNGSRVFALNSDGATVRIIDAVRATDLENLVGSPVVRHLELRGAELLATIGKHTVVAIDRASGEITSVVSD